MKGLRRRALVWAVAAVLLFPAPPLRARAAALREAQASRAPENLEDLSLQLAGWLEQGEPVRVTGTFSPALAAELDTASLSDAFGQALSGAGAFTGFLGVRSFEDAPYSVVDVYAGHQVRPLKLRFVHGDGGLEGLWFLFASDSELLAFFGLAPPPPITGEGALDHPVRIGPLELRGTLVTPPEGAERLGIAVLLVPGSGPCDLDGTVPGTGLKPYRDLALGLARMGICSLRFDKRSFAEPESFAKGPVTVQTEILTDVSQALELLRTHEETRGSACFVIGHSLGGMLVPEILRAHPFLKGAVVMGGSPRPLWDILFDQAAALLTQAGLLEDQARGALEQLETQRDKALAMTPENAEEVFGFPGEYVLSLNALALEEQFGEVGLPLLILQGGADRQVRPDRDTSAFEALLRDNENATLLCYEGLDHFFARPDGAVPAMDEAVIRDIGQWLWKRH